MPCIPFRENCRTSFVCFSNEPVAVAYRGRVYSFVWTEASGWIALNKDGSERLSPVPKGAWTELEAASAAGKEWARLSHVIREHAKFVEVRCDDGAAIASDMRSIADVIDTLRAALKPFAYVASGIPDNWPGECRLSVCERVDGSEYLSYHGVNGRGKTLPTIAEWRAAEAAGKEE